MKKHNRWTVALDDITAQMRIAFQNLTNEELNWKPNPDIWSIAQNIEHIIVVNETYYPILNALEKRNYKISLIGKIGLLVSFFEKIVLNAVAPNRAKKMKTFLIWEPNNSRINDDILRRFYKHQDELKRKIEDADVFVKEGTVIASPANKYIVYRLEIAFDIIIAHESRHLIQANQVLKLIKSNIGVK